MQDSVILYSYFRSSASYRVRIALHFKKIQFEYKAIHLIKDGGQQYEDEFKKLNPHSQVPCIVHNDRTLTQSMAIIQYIDDVFKNDRLFPEKGFERAQMIQFCETINSGIQPLQNLMVLKALGENFAASQEQKNEWVVHWNNFYLKSLEKFLANTAGDFCFGDRVSAADCFLIPQIFSSKRFGVDLTSYPLIQKIYSNALKNDAFIRAAPENQPDFES